MECVAQFRHRDLPDILRGAREPMEVRQVSLAKQVCSKTGSLYPVCNVWFPCASWAITLKIYGGVSPPTLWELIMSLNMLTNAPSRLVFSTIMFPTLCSPLYGWCSHRE